MSFILDALKKSETERQRQDAPGIASIPQAVRNKRSTKWIWLIGGLLVINLGVLSGLILRSDEEPQVAEVESAPATVEAEQPDTTFSDMVSQAKRSQPAPVAAGQVAAVTSSVAEDPVPEVIYEPTPAASEGLATFNELRAQGILQLPDMHLDIHVYSGQPADRFVFVNMSKYKEYATLAEGPVVTEITPDGVVLDYRGTAFLLPRE